MSRLVPLSCHVPDQVRGDYNALAKKRELTTSALLRQTVIRDLYAVKDPLPDVARQSMFLTIAVDALLAVQSDPALRERVLQAWRDGLAEEARRHD